MAFVSYNQMLLESEDPLEVEIGPTIEITNIQVPGGSVITGPVHFQLDDSVSETIGNLVEDFDLPKHPNEYNLFVTTTDGETTLLKRSHPIEDYLTRLQAYTKLELRLDAPPAASGMAPQDVGVQPKPPPQN